MKNQYFIKFYNINLKGDIVESIGSDSVCSFDGRMNYSNIKTVALNYNESLKSLNKCFVGFSVHFGTYSDNKEIHSFKRF